MSDHTLVDITPQNDVLPSGGRPYPLPELDEGLFLTLDPVEFMRENLPRVQYELDRATTNAEVQNITSAVATPLQLAAQQAGERIHAAAQQALVSAQEENARSGLAVASHIPPLNRAQRRNLR